MSDPFRLGGDENLNVETICSLGRYLYGLYFRFTQVKER
jgi:hypothetical protein